MHKGGYVDHPADPGGATNLGITHTTLAAWWGRPVTKYEWTSPGDGKGAPPQAFTSR
jgi:lysozyme family protein